MTEENGMYGVEGGTGRGCGNSNTPSYHGTRKAAERECANRNKEGSGWRVVPTNAIGAYPRDDPRYEED